MAATNRDRVGSAMDTLKEGLMPFVSREFINHYRGSSAQVLQKILGEPVLDGKEHFSNMDAAALLRVMWESWNEVYRDTLGYAERSLVSELRDIRIRWAHQKAFSGDDAYRALDSTHRLLLAVSAPEAGKIEGMKMELLRVRFDEQARTQRRKTASAVVESQGIYGLAPWREVVSPHQDVASGRYQQAEFAADLWQVQPRRGVARIPRPLGVLPPHLLDGQSETAIERRNATACGDGRGSGFAASDDLRRWQDPLYAGPLPSLFRQRRSVNCPAWIRLCRIPESHHSHPVNRVVLVGNRISPGNPVTKADGTEVRTLWGELAWQLGQAAGGEV